MMPTVKALGLAVAGIALAAPASHAQTYPSKQITLIVPYAPGGTGDIVARAISDRLGQALGQSVVVENRAGASGSIGTKNVIAATPDGHTLLVGQTGEIAITPNWGKGTGYDATKDLAPVALATIVPLAMVSPSKVAFTSVKELIAEAAKRPVSFASSGTGTPGHFAGEVLRLKTKANMAHVPYKGASLALNDLLGGHTDFFFSGFPAAAGHVAAGSLKLLAVSSGKRSAIAPDVPTVAEASGITGFDITLWQGFFAPKGTPPEIVQRLNTEINKISQLPDVKPKLVDAGADVMAISVDDFAAFVKAESDKFTGIIKEAGILPE
jgi:tripartite-type tricarboxylate transporter receptor subunit TctC